MFFNNIVCTLINWILLSLKFFLYVSTFPNFPSLRAIFPNSEATPPFPKCWKGTVAIFMYSRYHWNCHSYLFAHNYAAALGSLINEPWHDIVFLFILRKLILQTRMRSHPVGLDVWFLDAPFVYFHISCVQTAKALVRLRGCAGSPEPSLVAYVISTIVSWAGSFNLPYNIKFAWSFLHSKWPVPDMFLM